MNISYIRKLHKSKRNGEIINLLKNNAHMFSIDDLENIYIESHMFNAESICMYMTKYFTRKEVIHPNVIIANFNNEWPDDRCAINSFIRERNFTLFKNEMLQISNYKIDDICIYLMSLRDINKYIVSNTIMKLYPEMESSYEISMINHILFNNENFDNVKYKIDVIYKFNLCNYSHLSADISKVANKRNDEFMNHVHLERINKFLELVELYVKIPPINQ
jgi:hypothetical protein